MIKQKVKTPHTTKHKRFFLLWFKKNWPEPHETQELKRLHVMCWSILINRKVINSCCYVSENIIFSNLNLTDIVLSILRPFPSCKIKKKNQSLRPGVGGYPDQIGSSTIINISLCASSLRSWQTCCLKSFWPEYDFSNFAKFVRGLCGKISESVSETLSRQMVDV